MQGRVLNDGYMLRLPDGWRDAIKIKAARNRRSMNSEILAALEGVVGEASGGEIGVMTPDADRTGALQGSNSTNGL